jgi:RsmE family RNA methyltransferase
MLYALRIVNIILFEPEETEQPLPLQDPRARHIVDVLRRSPGESFDAGLIDGPRGKATLLAAGPDGLNLAFEWGDEPPPLYPVSLVIGMPRPQTARKILQEATSLGVSAMSFVRSDRGETSYGQSTLWSSGEWRRHLIAGAQQAFCTRLPRVEFGPAIGDVCAALPEGGCRLALDNYEAARPLARVELDVPVTLALGPERGWSEGERGILREQGFELVHLGERVLRTETACLAAVTLVVQSAGFRGQFDETGREVPYLS